MAPRIADYVQTLLPNTLTPLVRTPWAGHEIYLRFKKNFGIEQQQIGESWEFSLDKQFSSVLASGETLRAFLGRSAADAGSHLELLVKLIEAASPLSVQVHPTDEYGRLKPTESGKPEAWYVISSQKGAGVYLGLKPGISKEDFFSEMKKNPKVDASKYMNFVETLPGDYFRIEPGLLHALGPGVLVLEPQGVTKGKQGVTYRVWDWNRRYDALGALDQEKGSPRELHIEEAYDCTRADLRFDRFNRDSKDSPWTEFPSTSFGGFFRLFLKDGPQTWSINIKSPYAHFFMLKGRGTIGFQNESQVVTEGQSLVCLKSRLNFKNEGSETILLISTIGHEGIEAQPKGA